MYGVSDAMQFMIVAFFCLASPRRLACPSMHLSFSLFALVQSFFSSRLMRSGPRSFPSSRHDNVGTAQHVSVEAHSRLTQQLLDGTLNKHGPGDTTT